MASKSKIFPIKGAPETKPGKGPIVFADGKGVLHRQGDCVDYPGIKVTRKPKGKPTTE